MRCSVCEFTSIWHGTCIYPYTGPSPRAICTVTAFSITSQATPLSEIHGEKAHAPGYNLRNFKMKIGAHRFSRIHRPRRMTFARGACRREFLCPGGSEAGSPYRGAPGYAWPAR